MRIPARYFNPRPPRGGRHSSEALKTVDQVISIHALPAEGDLQPDVDGLEHDRISIHALPAEGDRMCGTDVTRESYFNPRPPRGGRHPGKPDRKRDFYFNPRPPRGGRQQKQLNFNLFFAHFREKFQSIGQKYPALNISIILFWCKNNKIQVRTSQHFLCAFASHQRIRTSSGK